MKNYKVKEGKFYNKDIYYMRECKKYKNYNNFKECINNS